MCYDMGVATNGRGPAHDFWLRVQRALDQADMSLRELVERSGVTATTIARLKTAPARDRRKRRDVVRRLAATLNEAVGKRFPGAELPFPDDQEVLRLAGLAPVEPDRTVSVRESIEHSAEYDDDQKRALLALLDVLDRGNATTRSTDQSA